MDKTKEYIKMCGKAREIQKNWTFQEWDYLVCKHYKEEGVVVLSGYETDLGCYGHGITGITDEFNCPRGKGNEFRKEEHIFIPQQSQLQEMLTEKWTIGEVFMRFYMWVDRGVKSAEIRMLEITLEKVWLKYVMQEKYNKKWNGEIWINTK